MQQQYHIGSTVFGSWIIKQKIGEGSFGQVFEIQREDFGQTYRAALKVISVPQSEAELRGVLEEGMTMAEAEQYFYSVVEDIVREFALMARLKGTANIVSYEDHTVLRHPDGIGWDILIRMELLTPLLTHAYAHPFSRRDIIQLGIDICKALELCQKYNIIHRDIKPENIFVSENGDFKLGDFGIARTIEKTMSGLSKKGTYNYMAPEVYRGGDYGFGVDLYSLGIVLYRLLNKNRVPFLPPPPEPITYSSREHALAQRMGGETIPKPFYGEGRLGEIVCKATAFNPKDRYSSPMEMRQELEAILYEKEDSELIYPDGDELALAENVYASRTPISGAAPPPSGESTSNTNALFSAASGTATADRTESVWGQGTTGDRTESVFGIGHSANLDATSKTESVFGHTPAKPAAPAKRKRKTWIWIVMAAVLVIGGAVGFYFYNQQQEELAAQAAAEQRLADYNNAMQQASVLYETAPEDAIPFLRQAQELFPENTEPYVGHAYALYRAGQYAECITYIEDELALGKNYDTATQSRLSEILGAAYFEQGDYAAAASFFRLSTAGGDITVAAMRDYAVSLGRLGDITAAEEVLQRMFAAGADNDVTDYVQGESDYAQKEYLAAEQAFLTVLEDSEDVDLQRRAMRSAAEVYRDCAALPGDSPIYAPATKEVELLVWGIDAFGLQHDTTLWEMLALAYSQAYHENPEENSEYLARSAECFQRVLDLGVEKDYFYSNLYTVYYEMGDYAQAELALQSYEAAFPDDYLPHALRAMMLITIENEKAQDTRNYEQVLAEYETASSMVRSGDDQTYLLQLASLIDSLYENGWID